jgi:hypothetical protein
MAITEAAARDSIPGPHKDEPHQKDQEAVTAKGHDIGENLYHEISDYTPEELEAERKVVLRKIDWRIMPMVGCAPNAEDDVN